MSKNHIWADALREMRDEVREKLEREAQEFIRRARVTPRGRILIVDSGTQGSAQARAQDGVETGAQFRGG